MPCVSQPGCGVPRREEIQVSAALRHKGIGMAAMPAVFVFLWSTGFIGVKFGLPFASPATFLTLRFILVVLLMLAIALAQRASWPRSPLQVAHLAVVGALVHGGYLGGVFTALHLGLSAGLVALIVGMQPVLTAFAAAPFLGERVSGRQWTGLLLGVVGVALAIGQRFSLAGFSMAGFGMSVVGLVSITAGTLYQKRYGGAFDLRTGSVIQFVAAAAVTAPFAYFAEGLHVTWTPQFLLALAWLVIVLSIGAVSLLAVLIRRGEATRIASLFYLVPPTTAAMAYLCFGETFSGEAAAGFALAMAGVALVIRRR